MSTRSANFEDVHLTFIMIFTSVRMGNFHCSSFGTVTETVRLLVALDPETSNFIAGNNSMYWMSSKIM